MTQKTSNKHLPLTEASYYILLALVTPNHGYAVMQEAEVVSQGTVRLAPGTIYGADPPLPDHAGKRGQQKRIMGRKHNRRRRDTMKI